MRPIFLLPCVALACATGRPAQETLPALKAAIHGTIADDLSNKRNSDLVEEVSESGHLLGMTRTEVEEAIGKGDKCAPHPLCAERGFEDDDLFYEVGGQGESYVRSRPVLIVGFDRFGKVVRTYNVRLE